MEIKEIFIRNFKSIGEIFLEDISPLMALVGPNGSGKSNFVDALKFIGLVQKYGLANVLEDENNDFYPDNIKNFNLTTAEDNHIFFAFSVLDEQKKLQKFIYSLDLLNLIESIMGKELVEWARKNNEQEYRKIMSNTKVFRIDPLMIKNRSSLNINPDLLNESGSNIAAVLEKLEQDNELQEEIIDWLALIVPELENIEISSNRLDGSKGLVFQEKSGQQFPAHMISDGTIYALCMLVAVLTRTKEPGITIIEEPERGLHPQAIEELIGFMRKKASLEHPIILTTHSESVVRALELNELYLVSKENGATKIKSVKNTTVDKRKIPLDTAWLNNLFNGGLPW